MYKKLKQKTDWSNAIQTDLNRIELDGLDDTPIIRLD